MKVATLALCAGLAGCASTKVEHSGQALTAPLCHAGADALSLRVFWGPQWRPDQKEPVQREAAALRGIQDFLADTGCARATRIDRLPGAAPGDVPSDQQLLGWASASAPVPDRVLLVVVRELGPRLIIGVPAIVEGGTEVVLDVRVLDVRRTQSLANVHARWRNGGSFVIKGVQTLPQDMNAALQSALLPAAPR